MSDREENLRAALCEDSTIDLDEHLLAVVRVVAASEALALPPALPPEIEEER